MKKLLNSLLKNLKNKKQQQQEKENTQHSQQSNNSDAEDTFDGLDVNSAIQAHLDWKTKLENAIKEHSIGHYDIKIVGADNHCLLGKWIHNKAKILYGKTEAYNILKNSHAKFHKVSAGILMDIHNEKYEEAKLKLKRDLSHSSDSVILDLIRLFAESI